MWGLAVNPFPSASFPDGPLPKGPLDTEKDDDSGSAAANAPPPTLRTHWWGPPSRKQESRIDSLVQRGHARCLYPERKQLDPGAPKERTPQCGKTRERDCLTVIACWGLIQAMVVSVGIQEEHGC